MLSSHKSKFLIGNKLSNFYDEIEDEYLDNIRAQFHLKALKGEQKFREDVLKSLSSDLMAKFNTTVETFTNFMEEWNQNFVATNDRITQESDRYGGTLLSVKQDLFELISKNEKDKVVKFEDIYNKIMKLKEIDELRESKNLSKFERTLTNLEEIKSTQDNVTNNLETYLLDLNAYQTNIDGVINDSNNRINTRLSSLESDIQNVSNNISNIDQRLILVSNEISSISKKFLIFFYFLLFCLEFDDLIFLFKAHYN